MTTSLVSASGTFEIGGETTVNRLGFGAMRLTGTGVWGDPADPEEAIRVLRRAVELGVTFIDTADSYGPFVSEQLIKQALHPYPDELVIATKAGLTRHGPGIWRPLGRPEYLRQQCHLSLRHLGLERIELYQLHRIDPKVALAEQLGALVELQQEGKIHHIGLSEVGVAELQEAQRTATIVSVQNLYNLLDRGDEHEALPECTRLHLAYLPFFPLASGLLTGKYTRGEAPPEGTRMQRWGDRVAGLLTDRNFDVADAVRAWAAERDRSLLDVAVAWLVANPVVASVIAGATKAEQVKANAAAGQWRLSPGDVADVEALAPDPE